MHAALIRPFAFILSPGDWPMPSRTEVAAAAAGLCTLNVLAGWTVLPILMTGVPAAVASSGVMVTFVLLVQALLLVVTLAFRWAVGTYIAWSLGAATGAARDTLPYAAAVVMADAVLVVREGMLAVIIWLQHDALAPGFQAPRIGLNLVVDTGAPFIDGLLNEINMFTVWHALVLAGGLRAFAGVTGRTSALTVAAIWMLLVAFGILAGTIRA